MSNKVKKVVKKTQKSDNKPKKKNTFDIQNVLNAYEFDTVLPGSRRTIRFRPITTGEMKRLLSFEGEENPKVVAKVMNDLISNCILDEDFEVEEMFLKDRPYLMLQMRMKTKGNKFNATYECEKCGLENVVVADLSKFEVKTIDFSSVDPTISISDELELEMRFLKVGDEIEAYNVIKGDYTKTKTQAEMVIAMYANSINSVTAGNEIYENLNIIDKIHFVENLPSMVYEKITEWHDTYDYGMDTSYKHKCLKCGKETNIDMSPDNFFFS